MKLINNQPDNDEIYLYTKVLYESKYQFLINKRESTGLNHFNDLKAFIENSNDIQDVYKNTEKCNLGIAKVLITFHDMIPDIINNKKLSYYLLIKNEY